MENAEQHEVKETQQQEQAEKPELDVEKLMARVEQLESSYNRVLDESKNWKSKYRGLRDQVEQTETKKLEESENWKELLDIEKNKAHELSAQLNHFKKETLKQKIHFEAAKHAPDAFDISDVITNLPQEMLSVDEESLTVKGIGEAIGLVKEKKPWLFNNQKSHGMAQKRPVGESGRSSYEDLTQSEKDDLFAKALSELHG